MGVPDKHGPQRMTPEPLHARQGWPRAQQQHRVVVKELTIRHG